MKNRLIAFAILAAAFTGSLSATDPAITVRELREHLEYLASDELQGRYPGTEGDRKTTAYIAENLADAGLRLLGKDGLQTFEVVTEIQPGPGNALNWQSNDFRIAEDFMPFPFSANGSVKAPVVFGGYGFDFDTDSLSWHDFDGLDARGKWVLILRSSPESQAANSPYINHATDRGKALKAFDRGAAGVIFVSGREADDRDVLVSLKERTASIRIPVIHVKRSLADRWLSGSGKTVLDLESGLNERKGPVSVPPLGILEASVDLQFKRTGTSNVAAVLEGSHPELKEEYVVVGAHHDHLGLGGPGSGSRRPDTTAVHPGADDNASGVAGIIELAEKLAALKPARSILFLAFGAEEMGTVGSRHFTENPLVDLGKVSLMVNLDMIGRLPPDSILQIGGTGTSPTHDAFLDQLNKPRRFQIKTFPEGFGPSDHASFYAKDVPVLFLSTGAHPDYHTPEDVAADIRFEGMRSVLEFTADLVMAAADGEKFVFQDAGPKVRMSSLSRTGGITFGLMPDVTYSGADGMPVQFVNPGRPAFHAGIRKGDAITAVDGKPVGNVYDYMSRLRELKQGQSVVVTVRREDSTMDLLLQL
ncbi:M20/M25/M40 family metallo-hydrolase [bacterium]|nr:M20/M25/M40 family metallo-hydrolase [bacterium]